MTPEQLNACSPEQASQWFMQTNTASRWIKSMVNSRPFVDKAQVKAVAQQHWQATVSYTHLTLPTILRV